MLIETDSDDAEGWVMRSTVELLNDAEWSEQETEGKEMMVVLPCVSIRDTRYARQLLLPAGSILTSHLSQTDRHRENRFEKISEDGWIVPGAGIDPEKIGRELLSIPGLQGGRCGFGFDAPGLVQMLCRAMGIRIPHSISSQALQGSAIHFIHEAKKGDLAFFQGGDDQITHVGMVLDGGKIIHVTDQVRIDSLDQQGIYCDEKEQYTHQLRIVKSVKS